jgi:hypothetical protein
VLEVFIDNTDGMNGGEWKKLFEFTDDGTRIHFHPICTDRHSSELTELQISESRSSVSEPSSLLTRIVRTIKLKLTTKVINSSMN